MKYTNLFTLRQRQGEIERLYGEFVPVYKRGKIRNLIRLCLFFVWCVIWIESALRYYGLNYVDFDIDNPKFYLMSALIFLVSMFIFKPYLFFASKNTFGKIEKIERESEVVGNKRRFSRRDIYVLTIRMQTGRLITKKLEAFHHFCDVYKQGSSISLLCGIKLPVPMDRDVLPRGKYFCTKCGSFEPDDYKRCALCHELLWYK